MSETQTTPQTKPEKPNDCRHTDTTMVALGFHYCNTCKQRVV